MTTADPVGLLVGALRIYSPSTEEGELAEYLCDSMKTLGYSRVRLDRSGNAIGEGGSGKTSLLLCGHMDTVPGILPVRRTPTTLHGRGAADAKSPLCALLLAGAESMEAGVRVTFAGVTQEEGNGEGIEGLLADGSMYDCAVFGEPSGANRITVGYRGRASLNVKVRTQGGHAGSSWAHRSAFDEFLSVLEKARDFESARSVRGDHYRSVSLTPTLVRSGTSHNVVPDSCEATIDLRVPPGTTVREVVRSFKRFVRPREPGASVSVASGPPTEPYEAPVRSKVVRALQRAVLLRLKTRPVLVRKTGTGDMNTFAQRTRGASCVTYGPGLSKTSHTDHEAVRVRDYLDSIEVLKEAVRQLGSLAENGDI